MTEIPAAINDGAAVFREPWEAQAFAIVLMLHERGIFTWQEWADALAAQIARAQRDCDPDRGDTYYEHWLHALESLVADKGISSKAELDRYRNALDHAADRTPHGHQIALQPGDFIQATGLLPEPPFAA